MSSQENETLDLQSFNSYESSQNPQSSQNTQSNLQTKNTATARSTTRSTIQSRGSSRAIPTISSTTSSSTTSSSSYYNPNKSFILPNTTVLSTCISDPTPIAVSIDASNVSLTANLSPSPINHTYQSDHTDHPLHHTRSHSQSHSHSHSHSQPPIRSNYLQSPRPRQQQSSNSNPHSHSHSHSHHLPSPSSPSPHCAPPLMFDSDEITSIQEIQQQTASLVAFYNTFIDRNNSSQHQHINHVLSKIKHCRKLSFEIALAIFDGNSIIMHMRSHTMCTVPSLQYSKSMCLYMIWVRTIHRKVGIIAAQHAFVSLYRIRRCSKFADTYFI